MQNSFRVTTAMQIQGVAEDLVKQAPTNEMAMDMLGEILAISLVDYFYAHKNLALSMFKQNLLMFFINAGELAASAANVSKGSPKSYAAFAELVKQMANEWRGFRLGLSCVDFDLIINGIKNEVPSE